MPKMALREVAEETNKIPFPEYEPESNESGVYIQTLGPFQANLDPKYNLNKEFIRRSSVWTSNTCNLKFGQQNW